MNAVLASAPAMKIGALDLDRRRHRRVPLALDGRYMLENRQEYTCRSIDISPGGIALEAPVPGRLGERVIVYLDTLGRLEGMFVRSTARGFVLRLSITVARRERLVEQLTWLINRDALGISEIRRYDRIVPRQRDTTLLFDGGDLVPARIVDVSRSGVGVQTSVHPPIGQVVQVGDRPARVVRHLQNGIALEFLRLIPIEHFDDEIVL